MYANKKRVILFFILFQSALGFAEQQPTPSSSGGILDLATEGLSDVKSQILKMFEADPKESVSNCTPTEGATGTPICKQITASAKKLASATVSISTNVVSLISAKDKATLTTAIQAYESSVEQCHRNQLRASQICIAANNNELQDTLTAITAVTALTASSSTNQACSTAGKTLGLASAALTAYQSACTAAKSICLPSCGTANKALLSLNKLADTVQINPEIPALASSSLAANGPQAIRMANEVLMAYKEKLDLDLAKDENAKDFSTTAGKLSVCSNKYVQLLGSAAVGVKGLLDAKRSADACANQSAGVAEMSLDQKCQLTQYKNTQECICHLSPRTPGCNNGLEKIGEGSSLSLAVGAAAPGETSNNKLSLGDDLTRSPSGSTSEKPSPAGGSGPGGGLPLSGGLGSSTAGSGGTGGGGNNDGSGAYSGSYGYDDSGSGGGGWGAGGGGGSWGTDGLTSGQGLEAYLPDGEKDPNAMSALSEEPSYVTPEGGKSNFEKVRQVYSEVRSTLLDK